MHLRFLITLLCFFSLSQASIPGHNALILLNLSTYHSLDPYQKAIDGDINLHLTLVFTEMSNEMIAALKDSLEKKLHNDLITKGIRLNFKEFGMLGNHLVAFYAPNDWDSYLEFIEKIRHMVREMASLLGKIHYSQKNGVEYGRPFYKMDIRSPLPHVSLKYPGSSQEAQKLNALLQNKVFQKPNPLEIRLHQIEIKLTKATIL